MPADGSPIISRGGTASAPRGTVLVIEDDRALGRLLDDLLSEEGYAVALLQNVREEPVRDAVARLEPDCILLDSEGMAGYTQSWIDAAWIRERERPVPVVMFTVDSGAAAEALAAESERSRRAAFFAVLAKPFDLDILLDTVARAVATSAGAAPADGSSGPPAAHPLDTGVGAGDWGAGKPARTSPRRRRERRSSGAATGWSSSDARWPGCGRRCATTAPSTWPWRGAPPAARSRRRSAASRASCGPAPRPTAAASKRSATSSRASRRRHSPPVLAAPSQPVGAAQPRRRLMCRWAS